MKGRPSEESTEKSLPEQIKALLSQMLANGEPR